MYNMLGIDSGQVGKCILSLFHHPLSCSVQSLWLWQCRELVLEEVDIGLAADVGTLQRLPKVIGSSSLVNELALTVKKMYADEAKESGLVSRVFPDKEVMMAGALEMAGEIAGRSPVAVQGTKVNLIYSRDHSVAEGLNYMATWNMSMLQTEDVMKSAVASMEKKSPKTITFSRL
nr:delta(3,5)-Delta(2,4)-dienoyl-CoA isomerase, mitochondrial-like [Oncorhynchus nerka]